MIIAQAHLNKAVGIKGAAQQGTKVGLVGKRISAVETDLIVTEDPTRPTITSLGTSLVALSTLNVLSGKTPILNKPKHVWVLAQKYRR